MENLPKIEPPKPSSRLPVKLVSLPSGFTCQKLLIGLVNGLITVLFIFFTVIFLLSGGASTLNNGSSSSSTEDDLVGGLDGNISVFLLLFLYFFSGAYGALGESERLTWCYFAFTIPLAVLLVVCSLCSLHRLISLGSGSSSSISASFTRVLGHTILILLTGLWVALVGAFARNLHRLKRKLSRESSAAGIAGSV